MDKPKTNILLPGGGLQGAAYQIGFIKALMDRGLDLSNCRLVGISGGGLAAYLLARMSPVDAFKFVSQFKKSDDAYKLNFILRLFGWFFIANGLSTYDKFIKALKKQTAALQPTGNVIIEVLDTKTGWIPEVVVNPSAQDVINGMSILGMVELTDGPRCDAGLVNVVPIHALSKVVEREERILVIDGAHLEPPRLDASDMTWRENLEYTAQISAWNTYENDLAELRARSYVSNEVAVFQCKTHAQVSDFGREGVTKKFAEGLADGKAALWTV